MLIRSASTTRLARRCDRLVPVAVDDRAGGVEVLSSEAGPNPGAAGQFVQDGQFRFDPMSGGHEILELSYHVC